MTQSLKKECKEGGKEGRREEKRKERSKASKTERMKGWHDGGKDRLLTGSKKPDKQVGE